MPRTQAYVLEQLTKMGLSPRVCGNGVVADFPLPVPDRAVSAEDAAAELDRLTGSAYPLTIFTCTRDGVSRFVLRCEYEK